MTKDIYSIVVNHESSPLHTDLQLQLQEGRVKTAELSSISWLCHYFFARFITSGCQCMYVPSKCKKRSDTLSASCWLTAQQD